MKYSILSMLLFGLCLFISYAAAETESSHHINAGDGGVALQGYDPVSYFSGTPTLGKPMYASAHGGIQYFFVSQENMERFNSTPDKYLPAYGGWCAWAMLDGEKVDVNPERFKIIDGINYLYYDGFWGNTLKKWDERAEKETEVALIRQAGDRWKKIVSE